MYILIKEHSYNAKDVDGILDGISNLRDVNGNVSINYMGYYYNPHLNVCAFILPKILIDNNVLAFKNPTDIIDLEKNSFS